MILIESGIPVNEVEDVIPLALNPKPRVTTFLFGLSYWIVVIPLFLGLTSIVTVELCFNPWVPATATVTLFCSIDPFITPS